MSHPSATIDFASLSKSWHEEKTSEMGKGEERYPADYVAFAWNRGYNQGKEDGAEQALRDFIDARWTELHEKAIQLASLRERLYFSLKEKNFEPLKTFLRIEPDGTFDLLFLVRHEDFVSEKFREIYAIARELRLGATTEEFNVNIGFLPDGPELDQNLILEDGYQYTHTTEAKAQASR
jgi:hypothetical protein